MYESFIFIDEIQNCTTISKLVAVCIIATKKQKQFLKNFKINQPCTII